ncbi:MAG: hypothetical protein MHPSP_000530, partial [Paramarteilia canceri]
FERSARKIYKAQNKALALAVQKLKIKIKTMKSEYTKLKQEYDEALSFKKDYENLKKSITSNLSLISVADNLMEIDKSCYNATKKISEMRTIFDDLSANLDVCESSMKNVRHTMSNTISALESSGNNELFASILPGMGISIDKSGLKNSFSTSHNLIKVQKFEKCDNKLTIAEESENSLNKSINQKLNDSLNSIISGNNRFKRQTSRSKRPSQARRSISFLNDSLKLPHLELNEELGSDKNQDKNSLKNYNTNKEEKNQISLIPDNQDFNDNDKKHFFNSKKHGNIKKESKSNNKEMKEAKKPILKSLDLNCDTKKRKAKSRSKALSKKHAILEYEVADENKEGIKDHRNKQSKPKKMCKNKQLADENYDLSTKKIFSFENEPSPEKIKGIPLSKYFENFYVE